MYYGYRQWVVCVYLRLSTYGRNTLAGKSAVISGRSPMVLPSLVCSVSLDLRWIHVSYNCGREKDNASSGFW